MVELSLYIPLPSFSLLPFPLLLSYSFILFPSSPPVLLVVAWGRHRTSKRRLIRPLGTLTGVCSFLSGRKAMSRKDCIAARLGHPGALS